MTRTYSREDWNTAQFDWQERDFSPEWKPYRHQAAMRGILYAPIGDKYDSWEADEPSQRAILVRAIRDTPALMHEAIEHSRSWGEVVGYIIRRRDDWRDELDQRDREIARQKAEDRPAEAAMDLKLIIQRIADS